ncbi:MAG: hypothetical protein NVSMB6_15830 [Burkholderiaceae bacterium]
MAVQEEKVSDIYTRKVGGEQYTYTLTYTPGVTVEWRAKVFRDGELKGTPDGVLSENTLAGVDLRQTIITLIEITIENMLGIAE